MVASSSLDECVIVPIFTLYLVLVLSLVEIGNSISNKSLREDDADEELAVFSVSIISRHSKKSFWFSIIGVRASFILVLEQLKLPFFVWVFPDGDLITLAMEMEDLSNTGALYEGSKEIGWTEATFAEAEVAEAWGDTTFLGDEELDMVLR